MGQEVKEIPCEKCGHDIPHGNFLCNCNECHKRHVDGPTSAIPAQTPRLDRIVEGVVLSEEPPLELVCHRCKHKGPGRWLYDHPCKPPNELWSIPGFPNFFYKLADTIEAEEKKDN
jgi:hypothetical protein